MQELSLKSGGGRHLGRVRYMSNMIALLHLLYITPESSAFYRSFIIMSLNLYSLSIEPSTWMYVESNYNACMHVTQFLPETRKFLYT